MNFNVQPKFVKIVVSDGGIFNVHTHVVEMSPTLMGLVDAFCEQLGQDHVLLMDIKSTTFKKFLEWGERYKYDRNVGKDFLTNPDHDSDRMLEFFFKDSDCEVEDKPKEEEPEPEEEVEEDHDPEEEDEAEESDEAEEEQEEEENSSDEERRTIYFNNKPKIFFESEDEEEESSEDDEANYIKRNFWETPKPEEKQEVREILDPNKFKLSGDAVGDLSTHLFRAEEESESEEENVAEDEHEAEEELEAEDEDESEEEFTIQDIDEIKHFDYRDPFNDDKDDYEEIETDSDKAWLEFCISEVDYNRLSSEDKALIQIIHGLPFDIPLSEWDLQFFLGLSFGEAHALLVAARYLNVPDLQLICGTYIGLILKGKTKRQIQKLLSSSRKRPLDEIDFDELDRYFDTLIDTKRQKLN